MSTSISSQWRQRPSGTLIAAATVLLITLIHYLFGGRLSEIALLQTGLIAVILTAVLADPKLRQELMRSRGLGWVGGPFLLTLLAAVWAITPYVPGGPHPAWSYVGSRGGAAVDPSSTVVEIIKLLGLACFFLVGATLGASDRRARLALGLIFYGGALFAAWALVAWATGAPDARFSGRLSAHFQTANTPATLFGCHTVLGLAMAVRRYREAPPRQRWTALAPVAVATLVCIVALICTASRAGIAAMLIGLSAYGLSQFVRRGGSAAPRIAISVIVLMGVIGLLIAAGDQLITRFLAVEQDYDLRKLIVETHWRAFLASPFNGYGLGGFEAVNRIYQDPHNFQALWNLASTHNVYVQWLEEGGVAAALPMFATIGAIMVIALAGALKRERMTGWLFALLACDLIILAHGWTDFALQTPSFAAFWALLLGLQFRLAQGSRGRAVSGQGRVKFAAAATIIAFCAVGAVAGVWALNRGAARVGPVIILQTAIGYDRVAEAAFLDPGGAAGMRVAEEASRNALSISPFDNAARLRLAYIDVSRSGRMTDYAARLLQESYDLVALDERMAKWRVRFALENWESISPQTRRAVQAEAEVLMQPGPTRRLMRMELERVSSPTGRMVAAFWLNQISSSRR